MHKIKARYSLIRWFFLRQKYEYKPFGTFHIIYGALNPVTSASGEIWAFGFSDLSDITRIEISFTGSKNKGIGLAFNNFSTIEEVSDRTNSMPEPPTLVIFIRYNRLSFVRFKKAI